MVLKYKYYILVFIIGGIIGAFSRPAKIIEKEHVVTVTKEVEKKTSNTDKQQDNNKITTIVIHTNKDGSSEKTTTITDKSKINIDTTSKDNASTDISQTLDRSKETIYSSNNVHFRIMVGENLSSLGTLRYGAGLDKQFIGPITIGVWGFLDKTIGMSLGLTW